MGRPIDGDCEPTVRYADVYADDDIHAQRDANETAELEALIRRPTDVTYEEISRYVSIDEDEFNRPFDFADDVSHLRWALATADSYRGIGRKIWQEDRPELLMVYIEGTDSISHLFGHLFGPRPCDL